jgi:8-oxo-dGTP pyrophosphatase MutT (NUDIX family)
MTSVNTEETKAKKSVPIRPAATLLLVRDGESDIEVLVLKRSQNLRFLPGYVAYPGGVVEEEDRSHVNVLKQAEVTAGERSDDAIYAAAALRECAEEIGLACALTGGRRNDVFERKISTEEQLALLSSQVDYHQWLHQQGYHTVFQKLRFVGRWVTPLGRPARFDTRFFVYRMTGRPEGGSVEPAIHEQENEWARWLRPSSVLSQIAAGKLPAVAPTIAMLNAIARYDTSAACAASLSVPGPPDEL